MLKNAPLAMPGGMDPGSGKTGGVGKTGGNVGGACGKLAAARGTADVDGRAVVVSAPDFFNCKKTTWMSSLFLSISCIHVRKPTRPLVYLYKIAGRTQS
jgi:hypothetical protein